MISNKQDTYKDDTIKKGSVSLVHGTSVDSLKYVRVSCLVQE